jgi:hypothetical protein
MTSLAEALQGPGGVERSFHCPVHDDSHPSASVNIVSGLWICYSCGAKGKAGDGYSVDPDALVSYLKDKARLKETKYFPESWLNLYGGDCEYWRQRFSQQACEHFQLGYDAETDSATYPVRDAGGYLLGVVRRPLSPDWDGGKYIYPRHVDVTRYLFNYSHQEARRRVLLVEGAADAIAAWEAGYEAYAIYGSRLSEEQVRLLHRVGAVEIWTAFDNDEAGQRAHNRVLELCAGWDVHQVEYGSWKDLAEISITTRSEVLSQLGKPDHGRVESTTCESRQQTLLVENAVPSSSGTSKPGRLRISRTRK